MNKSQSKLQTNSKKQNTIESQPDSKSNEESEAEQNNLEDQVSGQLRKLKTRGFKLFSNTNLRWVELDFERRIFGYKISKFEPRYKEYHSLTDFLNFNAQTSLEDRNKSKWKFGFWVNFKGRNYTFYAESETEYEKWKRAFTRVVNIFITYKDINLYVFKLALEKFAKPYFEKLELKRLREIEEKEKKEKNEKAEVALAAEAPPEKKEVKANHADLVVTERTADKPKTDEILDADVKRVIDEENENAEVNRKLVIGNNSKENVLITTNKSEILIILFFVSSKSLLLRLNL